MVKDFSWNNSPWNALLFEKTLKQLSILDVENWGFIVNTCHDTAKTKVGFPVIFSRFRWPIEPRFSQVCYFIYKLWYTKCWPLDNTVYRKCPMAVRITPYTNHPWAYGRIRANVPLPRTHFTWRLAVIHTNILRSKRDHSMMTQHKCTVCMQTTKRAADKHHFGPIKTQI